jgi:hypothetical protein
MTDRTMRILSFGLVPLEMSVNGRRIKKETVVPTGVRSALGLAEDVNYDPPSAYPESLVEGHLQSGRGPTAKESSRR